MIPVRKYIHDIIVCEYLFKFSCGGERFEIIFVVFEKQILQFITRIYFYF